MLAALLAGQIALGQTIAVPERAPQQAPEGKVVFSSEHSLSNEAQVVSSSSTQPRLGPPDALPSCEVTDVERTSIQLNSYHLDLHLLTAHSREEMHATMMLRNVSNRPLVRFPLQISSTLRWQAISRVGAGGLRAVTFTQSPIATDTDHTGYVQEAVVTLETPLAPGASLALSVFYIGEVRQTAARLELLGAPTDRADEADWDEIAPSADDSGTALRGFGSVLWYPVAAPVAALGDGNKVVEGIGLARVAGGGLKMGLRVTVEYTGEAPVGVVFDGELRSLTATADDPDQLVAEGHGVATAEFPERMVGFRIPSLFLTAQQPTVTEGQLLSVVTARSEVVEPYAAAAEKVRPLLVEWFGATPLEPLLLLDHRGEPFGDHALLVGQLAADAKPDDIAPTLVSSLSHAWFRSSHPWISEGLAQFMNLLWTERTKGRDVAVAELAHAANLLALAEPDLSGGGEGGQALTEATSEVYLRSKAAGVFWQLRDILGEEVLRKGIAAYRRSVSLSAEFDRDPKAMQRTLEKVSGKELGWFFEDWVYRDRSLPDLSIVQVSPHAMPARGGKATGYIVAVEVRNEGDAVAEVPVTVRAGQLKTTERLRIAGHGSTSIRIEIEERPDAVQVNDGNVPELRASIHLRQLDFP